MTEAHTLRCDELVFGYGGKKVLRGLSFGVSSGEVLGLVGPNGAGKTTTMNLLSGILQPHSGSVHFDGVDVTHMPAHKRAQKGMVRTYQALEPLRGLTVLENVALGALYGRERCRSVKAAKQLARHQLKRVGLNHREDVLATQVSSGQKKLMDLARALCMRPELMLMDEPLAALSQKNRDLVLRIVQELKQDGCAVVLIEHVMKAVLQIADYLVVVDQGRALASGLPRVVVKDPAVLAAYIGPEPEFAPGGDE